MIIAPVASLSSNFVLIALAIRHVFKKMTRFIALHICRIKSEKDVSDINIL